MHSIWASLEADAWSRGFDHAEYMRSRARHKAAGYKVGAELDEVEYDMLCKILDRSAGPKV